MADYVAADTTAFSSLTKVSGDSRAYQQILGERRLAVSFQTPPELRGTKFGPPRQKRIDELLAATLVLPHAESTDVWYARVAERRNELRKLQQPGAGANEADIWIISSALEHRLPFMSHDIHQVCLGRAMGLPVLTNLDGLRDDNPQL